MKKINFLLYGFLLFSVTAGFSQQTIVDFRIGYGFLNASTTATGTMHSDPSVTMGEANHIGMGISALVYKSFALKTDISYDFSKSVVQFNFHDGNSDKNMLFWQYYTQLSLSFLPEFQLPLSEHLIWFVNAGPSFYRVLENTQNRNANVNNPHDPSINSILINKDQETYFQFRAHTGFIVSLGKISIIPQLGFYRHRLPPLVIEPKPDIKLNVLLGQLGIGYNFN